MLCHPYYPKFQYSVIQQIKGALHVLYIHMHSHMMDISMLLIPSAHIVSPIARTCTLPYHVSNVFLCVFAWSSAASFFCLHEGYISLTGTTYQINAFLCVYTCFQDEDPNAIYCVCRQPYHPKLFMIQCDKCNEWYHGKCIGIKEYVVVLVPSLLLARVCVFPAKHIMCRTCVGYACPEQNAVHSENKTFTATS